MTIDPIGAAGANAPPVVAYVGLGANLGDAKAAIASAILALRELPGTAVARSSALYRSAAVGAEGPDYLNAVVELQTSIAPAALLRELLRIESEHGRERRYRNAPRTLDLDLLLYGGQKIATPELTVPHPRLHERAFVLRPLAEIAPALSVPGRGTVADLLQAVAGQRVDKI